MVAAPRPKLIARTRQGIAALAFRRSTHPKSHRKFRRFGPLIFLSAFGLLAIEGRAPAQSIHVPPNEVAAEYAQESHPPLRPFSRIGFDLHAGLGGIGLDVATPLSRTLNLRAGSDFFVDSASFEEQGVSIGMKVRMQASRASIDWFPFGGSFRLSPVAVFANNNHLAANAVVPSGETMTLSGNNFVSSSTDPLHGSASVDFRKVAPGLTLGFGNLVPRNFGGHTRDFSFPSETGFYYVGQPRLKVAFSGGACTAGEPRVTGCGSVSGNATFQQGLAEFETRMGKNLKYISFFPIFSAGVGYAF